MARIVKMHIRCSAEVSASRAALAVERYRLKEGEYPERLSDIVPKFIEQIPKDPFDGNDLRYKKLPDGFVVYSIGADGIDNWPARNNDDYVPAFEVRREVHAN